MSEKADRVENLSREDIARLVMDMFHRIIIHYALWFTEVRHQMGMEKALDTLKIASDRSIGIQMKRLSKVLGFQIKNGMPNFLADMSKESLTELLDSIAVNWLANDGVWFQAVEFESGMNDAKRCNDSCWAHFSPFEAWSIIKYLDLPKSPGLEGLKKALGFRLYARINTQSIIEEGPDSFIFQMNECLVHTARKRKGLADYPCKSVGLVEYPYFARTIDDRITTECIGCPPDEHPKEWYCAWRFSIRAE
ncbi:MAG: cytosolic protein [Deltaproteobacteria bacterium]|nr:cytosolic protein [Deltaproteobacteria bacterium]